MKTSLWCLSLWMLVGAACTHGRPLDGRQCPCAAGWICCTTLATTTTTGMCVRSADQCPPEVGSANQCTAQGAAATSDVSGPSTSTDPTTVVTPVACGGGAPPLASLPYAPGYTPDPALSGAVQSTLATLSPTDEAAQMRGTNGFSYSDTQRSEDIAALRGFRYRDGPRGMNLGENLDGAFPDAKMVNGLYYGLSTAFPVSIARAATFDVDLENAVGEAIGDEMQAANQTVLLAPCVNLLRHPLWGRAQDSYGEDPFESGRMGSAMAVGVQQHVLATAKHFAAYDIEHNRHTNNSVIDEQTLRETYGRAFRMLIQDGGVGSIMASVNKVNGTKSVLNAHLLTDVLRNDFGFQGFVLSDFWAFWKNGSTIDVPTLGSTASLAVKAGLDVELPWSWSYSQLENLVATNDGLTQADLDTAATRILEQKFRVNAQNLTGCIGLGAPKTHYSNSTITGDTTHDALAQQAALEGAVLLKNELQTLPITVGRGKKVVVLGASLTYTVTDIVAHQSTIALNFATDVLTGDLGASRVFPNPKPENSVSPLQGIVATAPSGVTVVGGSTADQAKDADFIVVIAGLTPQDEGDEYTNGVGDRASFALDAKQTDPQYQNVQNNLIQAAAALGKPMVVVLEGGSVIDMPWLASVPAVVMAWYPGQAGGMALGQLLWGNVGGQAFNFSGKLPLTWSQLADYPTFSGDGTTGGEGNTVFDYDVGYRYFDRHQLAPLYPFGYGLSYTTFEYRKLQIGCSTLGRGGVLPVVVNVANIGTVAGDETVMVFVSFPNSTARRPIKELKGFARVHLEAGEEKQVTIPVRLSDLDYFQMDGPSATTGKWVVESGDIAIQVGGNSAQLPLSATVTVDGYQSPPS